ncbi:MBL fold metallo-hydrolase [Altererythrobacter sp. KTW20L]|uniref:MBL fold metallo-hydrolase n=1 Tax=Altererythrobacter sp. KTW20L TaxID=2942210 RepID=UPI0020BE4B29|nr:MBL fold metallo-hydrolase [Altererythrobacter sp. KTW20L]MCL6252089.1 MBL fold metallo-hydrolase [Altererythrobacter sp. KTW20L]
MSVRTLFALPLLLASCAPATFASEAPPASSWTAQCEDWDDWDKSGPPFRIHGDTYYVGTCGIGAILITSESGHVLIDSGTEPGAAVVLQNIRSLGLDPADIAVVLSSHEHFDHVGGHALVQRAAPDAQFLALPVAAQVLRSGMDDPSDPQAGMHPGLEPVTVARELADGEVVTSSRHSITVIATPGHTAGATSFSWQSCDIAGNCRSIVYADSMSPVSADDYRFSDHPAYLAAYRAGVARFSSATEDDCDILLTPHPSASGLRDKLLAEDLTSGMNCRQYAASITERLDQRLAEEAATQ